jgi:hypothetical protein
MSDKPVPLMPRASFACGCQTHYHADAPPQDCPCPHHLEHPLPTGPFTLTTPEADFPPVTLCDVTNPPEGITPEYEWPLIGDLVFENPSTSYPVQFEPLDAPEDLQVSPELTEHFRRILYDSLIPMEALLGNVRDRLPDTLYHNEDDLYFVPKRSDLQVITDDPLSQSSPSFIAKYCGPSFDPPLSLVMTSPI